MWRNAAPAWQGGVVPLARSHASRIPRSTANLAYYQLLLLRPAGTSAWQEIARGYSSVTNGALGKLDPTQLANGIYELALNVVDANGQQTTQLVTLDLYRDLKIGQFAISFEDLNVDAAGIPIRVTRTYDTRRKNESLDFGYGWSVDYQSVQLRKNMVPYVSKVR